MTGRVWYLADCASGFQCRGPGLDAEDNLPARRRIPSSGL